MENDDFIILGGDGNELFEKTIRKGILSSFEKSDLRHLINIDLAPFVPFSKNGYKIPNSLIDLLLKSFENSNKGCVIIPGTIMPVADSKIIDMTFKSLNRKSIPTVSIGMKQNGFTSIFADDYQGILDMAEHLYDVHSCRKIAYVSGPDCYDDAAQRNLAYSEFCKNKSIDKIVAEGDFSIEGGKKAVDTFASRSELNSIDAVVCADDTTAIGVIERLKEKGFKIPGDIAVTGFDNSEYANSLGITSVDPLIKEQGAEAFFAVLNGSSSRNIKTAIVKNWSCGCSSMDIKESQIRNNPVLTNTDSTTSINKGRSIFGKRKVEIDDSSQKKDNINLLELLSRTELSSGMVQEVTEYLTDEGKSIDSLLKFIYTSIESVEDLELWSSKFKKSLDTILQGAIDNCDRTLIIKSLNLYQNCDSIVGHVKSIKSAKSDILSGYLKEMLIDIRSEIISASTIEDLVSAIKDGMKELEVDCFSMMLFESSDQGYTFSSGVEDRLIYYLNIKNKIVKKVDTNPIEAITCLRNEYEDIKDRSLTIVPLYYEEPFGLLLFGNTEPTIIQSIQESISLALENIKKREIEIINKSSVTNSRDKIIHLIEPLIGTARELSEFVVKEKQILIDNLNISSNDSIETIHKANRSVDDVNSHLNLIVKLIKSIDDITEKTEVLSINASIEAARAGEHGRGFKVISSAIKKLSEAQKAESERVDSHIKEVEKAMVNSISAGAQNQDAIDRVKTQINKAISFFDEIESSLDRIINNGNNIIQEIRSQIGMKI